MPETLGFLFGVLLPIIGMSLCLLYNMTLSKFIVLFIFMLLNALGAYIARQYLGSYAALAICVAGAWALSCICLFLHGKPSSGNPSDHATEEQASNDATCEQPHRSGSTSAFQAQHQKRARHGIKPPSINLKRSLLKKRKSAAKQKSTSSNR